MADRDQLQIVEDIVIFAPLMHRNSPPQYAKEDHQQGHEKELLHVITITRTRLQCKRSAPCSTKVEIRTNRSVTDKRMMMNSCCSPTRSYPTSLQREGICSDPDR